MARTGPAHSLIPKKKGAKKSSFHRTGVLTYNLPLKNGQNFAKLRRTGYSKQ